MIKLLVPNMPNTEDLLPYLHEIDANKVYVNNGKLVQTLEKRLAEITGVECVAIANGTLALELALKSIDNDYLQVTLPALTFSATGLAVHNANMITNLSDVDADSWQITPKSVNALSKHLYFKPNVVMPVATFGSTVDVKQWENYECPVVIDAAGAFPAQIVSRDPNISTCFSLHATKFIGCGEGGFIASNNPKNIKRIRSLLSFGDNGTNAKMSEYHAAVALASLDKLSAKCNRTVQVANWYAKEFYSSNSSLKDLKTSPFDQTSTMFNVLLPISAVDVIRSMLDDGIETKQWYRPYLDERDDFYRAKKLPVTDHLREHLLGIPFHNFLSKDQVVHVCESLRRAI